MEEKKKQEYGEVNIFENRDNKETKVNTGDLHLIEKTKKNILKKILSFIKRILK